MTHLIASLLLPPAGPLLLVALGLGVLGALPVAGYVLATVGIAALYLLSTPAVAHRLVSSLDSRYAVLSDIPAGAQAIIVLGGGRNRDADEYGGDTVEYFTLERLRYTARLQRESGLPILVSGGRLFGEARSEASMMKEALEQDFRVPVAWTESKSRDTFENAVCCAQVLAEHNISHALLVTHGWHMPRAVWSFQRAGMKVTPAPTACDTPRRVYRMLPAYRALYMASNALSEYLAMAWYRLAR
ncbi:MAG: YdcF family protein [Gammaproteobacteria bacterium]